MESFSALAFVGALAIFMYGIRMTRFGVQLLAGDRLSSLISRLTTNRLSALVTGMLVTLILQSSTATTVMLVGFATTGAITLTQAMGVILGADIGTTFVVILLSIQKVADYSLILLIAGVLIEILSRRKKNRYISMVLVGFGFVFFGMQLMVHTTLPLRESPILTEIFALLRDNPGYALFGATLFTALVQNSATTLGLAIACSFSGLLTITEAIPIVLGANIGTCVTSLVTSLGSGHAARQVAASHLLFKVTGVVVALIFRVPFSHLIMTLCDFLPGLGGDAPAVQIAITHVTFNLLLSLTFLPFIRQGAWLIDKLFPEPPGQRQKPFGPKYLETESIETPALSFANVKREILRMAEIVQEMFRKLIYVFEKDDRDLVHEIEEQDDQVDILDKAIKFYLAGISQETLTSDQARMQLNLLAITSDLEEIGDVINKNILELALKKINKGRHFSEAGWKEIVDVHAKVLENFSLTLSTLASEDETIARKVSRHEQHLAEIEDQYREAHLQRLHKGLKETIETSSIHLDLLSNLRRINSKLMAIVKAVLPGRAF